jgi:hypothetical protein
MTDAQSQAVVSDRGFAVGLYGKLPQRARCNVCQWDASVLKWVKGGGSL